MKNQEQWLPSKFAFRRGRWKASRDTNALSLSSRLVADLVAEFYDTFIPKYAKGRLLDLGCGKVPLFGAYRDYIVSSTCVDWELSPHGGLHVDHVCDLNKPLPFEEGAFDTVILSDVLEHIPLPNGLWAEMSRVLVPKGRVLANVPFYYWLHEAPHDYFRYTEYALKRFAENSGFLILVLEPIGGTPEILADMLAKHLEAVPIVGRPLSIALQYATLVFVRTLGRRLSQRTSRLFPLGYFLVAEKQ
jgi:SAM-dependent methyltransferase